MTCVILFQTLKLGGKQSKLYILLEHTKAIRENDIIPKNCPQKLD